MRRTLTAIATATALLSLFTTASLAAPGSEVGEWAVSAESCATSRLIFTANGKHKTKMFQGGKWQELATAPYRRGGNRITIIYAEHNDELEILDESAERLVVRNLDEAQMKALGMESITLIRCAP